MRRPRNLLPNSFVHITNRCEGFFLQETDMLEYALACLMELCSAQGIVLLAYCILANHLHLLTKVSEDVAKTSKLMHDLETRLACRYNRIKGRRGHFWQDRFHSTIVAGEGHFRNVISYIDANPLNHKGGEDPIHWKYCSYRELQVDDGAVSLVDRVRLLKAMRMASLREFTEWQRRMMKKRKGTDAIMRTKETPRFGRHYAVGTCDELRLLQKSLRKRGIPSYATFLENDEEQISWWALDLCSERFAKRHSTALTAKTQQP